MGIILHEEPELQSPDLIVGWPGIGNVGIIAVDTLREQLGAEELGEIEPWDFFYPRKVTIRAGMLDVLEFPSSKFYYRRLEGKDLLLFVGEEQPTDRERMYAEGRKAYQMANLVLDVAAKFGCRRVYTSGAAVTFSHHLTRPRVMAVATRRELLQEVRRRENVILMSEVGGREERGSITGLNGLVLGVAKRRGFDAVCLMGEVPDYLSGAPLPYPQASRSVLEVMTGLLGVQINLNVLDGMTSQMSDIIENIYQKFPPQIKERIEQRRAAAQKKEAITAEDEQWLKEHIDEFFKTDRGERGAG